MAESSRIFLLKHSAWRQDLILECARIATFPRGAADAISRPLAKYLIGDLGRSLPSAWQSRRPKQSRNQHLGHDLAFCARLPTLRSM